MGSAEQVRWRPARAGILNVYQYEDETLHFADGRLLLRGVNGSGKSTAMNMLLPFLLEADTRRIDAAGDQVGVLKSWMLAGTEETQRTGYLWLEFERRDAAVAGGTTHRTVGCGIRANRSTDRVTIWWFSTSRRPRIEFSLTASRVPLSIDALRLELGSESVFTAASDYRKEVARRLFGGADPSGYLALLHQVRNPRIGDRVDADLPHRLQEALPPVPEAAVADAAQPLEDLEEHRRNVTALERTDRALGSVLETYRLYARRVLRAAADRAAESVTEARSAAQRRGRLRTATDDADAAVQRLNTEVAALGRARETTSATLVGILSSRAYQQLEALIARRETVATQEAQAAGLVTQSEIWKRRVDTSARAAQTRRERLDGDRTRLDTELTDARRHCRSAGIDAAIPVTPELPLRVEDGQEGPVPGSDPLQGLDITPVADAVRQRRQVVVQLRKLVDRADRERTAAVAARDEAERAENRATDAQALAYDARRSAELVAETHRSAIDEWAGQLADHVLAVPPAAADSAGGWLTVPVITDPEPLDLRALAAGRVEKARAAADSLGGNVEQAVADATLRVRATAAQYQDVADELDRVRSASELPIPRAPWQRRDGTDGTSFAALVDFPESLDDATRSGLEAACEAAGLLAAEVRSDGTLIAESGELLLAPSTAVTPNLTAVLTPASDVEADAAVVTAVLSAIGLGAASAAPLWVDVDGRFGSGALRGRHSKAAAEHIGVGARAAARRRRIAALEAELAVLDSRRDTENAVLTALLSWREALRQLVRTIPSTGPVDDAVAAAVGAARDADRETRAAEAALGEAAAAERRAEHAWAFAETEAARHGLPATDEELQLVLDEVEESAVLVRRLPDRIDSTRRSFRDWAEAVAAQKRDVTDLAQAEHAAAQAQHVAADARTALDAAEAALGDEPTRVAATVEEVKAQLAGLDEDLEARRSAQTAAVEHASTARAELAGADEETRRTEMLCADQRETLRAVLDVDGLLVAARDGEDQPAGPVPDTVDGTARLVAAVRQVVPEPSRVVAEDALDRSLRQIRDALGAGWDAGSRRGEDGAPVAVEVSGPYGRRALPDAAVQVAADLRRSRGLLSAQQDQALRNLLHGRVAREVAEALFAAAELVRNMNAILGEVTTSQGIGVRLEWRTRDDLDQATATALRLLAKDPDARSDEEDAAVRKAVTGLVEDARAADPELSYRLVIARVLDYRSWHELKIFVRRPGQPDERLRRRTKLSEGEKKLVTYLPMAAAAAASAAAHDPFRVGAPRLILLDDAFAKVSEDNHARLFGLLVGLDLDFIVTSERLFGTHATVPQLSIVEVLRDPDLRAIALIHYHWDGRHRTELVPR